MLVRRLSPPPLHYAFSVPIEKKRNCVVCIRKKEKSKKKDFMPVLSEICLL
jgi:hypothetical protein